MRKARENGAVDSAEEYNAAHQDWLLSLGANTDKEPKRGGRRADWAGPDAVDRLFTEPLTTKMVLDTRNAKPVYDNIIKPSLASAMVHEDNALAACQVWLATRLLLTIFNVARGDGFEEARAYIDEQSTIETPGHSAAVVHWRRLHSHPEQRPPLLVNYTAAVQKRFDTLLAAQMKALREAHGDVDLGDPRLILALRRVFDNLGAWLLDREPLQENEKIATSLQLYARLPSDTAIDNTATFYSSSALPAPRWIAAALDEGSKNNLDAGNIVFEYVMSPLLPVWTVGAQSQGKAANSSQWYQRSRGYAQLANLILDAPIASTMESRLQVIITRLADPQLRGALRAIQEQYAPQIKALLADCSVGRSSPAQVPVLNAVASKDPETFGSPSALQKILTKARKSLQQFVQKRPFPSKAAIAEHMNQFSSLDRVFYPDFWLDFPTQIWLEGWNTAPSRRFQDVNSLVGWSIFLGQLRPLVNDIISRSKEAHWVLGVHTLLRSAYSVEDWGRHMQVPEVEETSNTEPPEPNAAIPPAREDSDPTLVPRVGSPALPRSPVPQYAVVDAAGKTVPLDLSQLQPLDGPHSDSDTDGPPPFEDPAIPGTPPPASFYQKRRGPRFGPSLGAVDTTTARSRTTSTSSHASLPPPPSDSASVSSEHDELQSSRASSPVPPESEGSDSIIPGPPSGNTSTVDKPQHAGEVTMHAPSVSPQQDVYLATDRQDTPSKQLATVLHVRPPSPNTIFAVGSTPDVDPRKNQRSTSPVPVPAPDHASLLVTPPRRPPPQQPTRSRSSRASASPLPSRDGPLHSTDPEDREGPTAQSPRFPRWPRYLKTPAQFDNQAEGSNQERLQNVEMPAPRLSLRYRAQSGADWQPAKMYERLSRLQPAGRQAWFLFLEERKAFLAAVQHASAHFDGTIYGRALAESSIKPTILQYEVMYVQRLVAMLEATCSLAIDSAIAVVAQYVDEDPAMHIRSADLHLLQFRSCIRTGSQASEEGENATDTELDFEKDSS
ncbi:hypothetical protein FRC10_001907 [Ceratobasidium sp. 414]|nr:hypothetical protein FRC10_001907 [Ceratobasidium sp. 414]